MLKHKKGLLFTAITLMILSIVLSACGGAKNESKDGVEPSKESTSATTEKPYEINFTYATFGNDSDSKSVSEAISKITKEKINATVKFNPINYSAFNQQVNLMLAGSEKLDILMTGYPFNYASQVTKNQLLPLDELIESDGLDLKGTFDANILRASAIKGKVYGIPTLRVFAQSNGVMMRKDLVDKYKIDINTIKTWSDLEPVFQLIKEKEPNIIPVTGKTIGYSLTYGLFDMFDTLGSNFGVLPYSKMDHKLVNFYETKEYSDAISLVNKWFKAGYVQKDIATSQTSGTELLKAGKAFAIVSDYYPGIEVSTKALNNIPVDLVGIQLSKPQINTSSIILFLSAITKNSENPKKAMQFLNLLYSDKEIANLVAYGVEGKHYAKKSDNFISSIADKGFDGNPNSGNSFILSLRENEDPQKWNILKQFDTSAKKSKALGFIFNTEPVKAEIAALTNVENQYRLALETGLLDPDKNLSEFLKKLNSAGLEKVITEKQKQLDEWFTQNSK